MRIPNLLAAIALTWLGLGLGAPLGAQEHRSLTLSGGIAGSLDESGTGFSNPIVQLRFAIETSSHGNLAIRLGKMDFDQADIRQVRDFSVSYLSVVGEYMFDEPSHRSGLFVGLGFFDLDATRFDGTSGDDEGSVGLVLGALGEFKIAERWFIYGEGSAAYTGLDVAHLFANLQVGVGFRF